MPKLPRVSGREVVKRLERLGFIRVRQRGSHVVLRKDSAEGVTGCVVPLHDELTVGTLRGVLRQAGISAEEFRQAHR